jgi:DNA modification methylase
MSITLLSGDCRAVLPTLASNSVHTCVTSPPYYALRSYLDAAHPDKHREIGSESTPDEYLATMVEVFREVRRVLRPDGTVWCNIGDSYSSGGRTTQCDPSGNTGTATLADGGARRAPAGIAKPKDLLLMPARLALALQADGWWVRSDIIWAKPNPMPESVTDRPTSAYEHVFLLTKSARYFYDAEAVREPHIDPNRSSNDAFGGGPRTGGPSGFAYEGKQRQYNPAGRSCRNVWTIATHAFSEWGETSRQVRVAWDAAVDGKKRKASPDCPVHGDHAVLAPNAPDGGHADGSLNRTARNGDDPAQAPTADCAPSDRLHTQMSEEQSSDLPLLECLPAATPRSNQNHRTDLAPATSQPCSASAETDDGTARTSEAPEPVGSAGHTLASNTSQDGSGDHPSARTADHSADMSSCCCEWYVTKTEKTSHFATFPPALAERCIRAGTSERGCCSACGAPWRRSVDTSYERNRHGHSGRTDASGSNGWDGGAYPNLRKLTTTTGWAPSCACAADVVPATVLDVFAGAGTTLLVADRLQRNAIGVELNTAYTEMAMERCRADAPLFADTPEPQPAPGFAQADLFAEAAD